MITVRVSGFEGLQKKVAEIVDSIRADEVIEDLIGAAEVIRESAASRAPKDTGQLASDIQVEAVDGKLAVKVGPSKDSFYGLFQEFGYGNSPAQPFMRPAFDENKEAFIAAFGENLQARLKFKEGSRWRRRSLIRKKRTPRSRVLK